MDSESIWNILMREARAIHPYMYVGSRNIYTNPAWFVTAVNNNAFFWVMEDGE